MSNLDIMSMETGTIIRNKRSNINYILSVYVNDTSRALTLHKYDIHAVDYINEKTQDDYEVFEFV